MPIYTTGKEFTITVTGTLEASRRGKLAPGTPETGDGELLIARAEGSVELYWRTLPLVKGMVRITAGVGKERGWLVEAWDGLGGYDSQDTRAIVTGGSTWDFTDHATGTYEISIDVEECVEITEGFGGLTDLDAVALNGFPTNLFLRIDDSRYFDADYGTEEKDGLPALYWRQFLRAKVGGNATATLEIEGEESGVASATTTTVIASAFEVEHTGVWTAYAFGFGLSPAWCRWTHDYIGLNVDDTYTRNSARATATVDDQLVKIEVASGPHSHGDKWGTATLVGQPPTKYEVEAKARTIGGGYASPPFYWWMRRQEDEGGGTWTRRAVAYDPSGAAQTVIQREYDCGSSLNGSIQTGVGQHEVCPQRLWCDTDSLVEKGEDTRDWRIQFQLFPAEMFGVEQDDRHQVTSSPSDTLNVDPSVPTLVQNWEGYRYVSYDLLNPYDDEWPPKIGDKLPVKTSFAFVPSLGLTWPTWDLCSCTNYPAGLEVDKRDTRYPLDIQSGEAYSPSAEYPQVEDLSDEEVGWRFGILQRIQSIDFQDVDPDIAITPTEAYLVRLNHARGGVLHSFRAGVLGWETETDQTDLWPLLWLYSDGKLVGPWPYAAHVRPKTADPESFAYWSLNNLKEFVENSPGWHGDIRPAPADSPELDGTTTKLHSGDSYAGWLESYIWDGSAWRDQTDRDVRDNVNGYKFWGCVKADEVMVYPGCPNRADTYGTNNPYRLKAAKVFRSQAEGLTLNNDDAVRILRNFDGANRGEGSPSTTNQGDLYYRTGASFARGHVNHRTELQLGTHPFEGPFPSHARYRHRTSFLAILSQGGDPTYDVDAAQRHWTAYVEDGTVRIGDVGNDVPPASYRNTGINALSVELRIDKRSRKQRIYLGVGLDGGGVQLHHSDDRSATWTMTSISATGENPRVFVDRQRRVFVYWIDGGNLVGKVLAPDLTTMIPLFTAVAGVTSAALDFSYRGGGELRVVAFCRQTGGLNIFTSIDGVTFS